MCVVKYHYVYVLQLSRNVQGGIYATSRNLYREECRIVSYFFCNIN